MVMGEWFKKFANPLDMENINRIEDDELFAWCISQNLSDILWGWMYRI
jgi:hypothetical protein